MDDVVDELCENVCRYEVELRALRAAGQSATAPQVQRTTQAIRLCEAWLVVLGKARSLERARATVRAA